MTENERRAAGVRRTSIETHVEICGRDVGGAAFEAETVEVSGRGMHLRAAYLPMVGESLVCRFESTGREVIAEGNVAWREETQNGGEFGVKFTALDAGSVAVLNELCGVEVAHDSPPPGPTEERAAPAMDGTRVRLHIEGLGSPMKARVRAAGSRQVRVGSNLEFLKVGRHLEIEDLDANGRRGAQIDSVSVALDPETNVPQLVVSLRYDEPLESTPEPSVIDSEIGASDDAALDEPVAAATEAGLPADDELVAEANAMRGRLGVAASNAGDAVMRGGAVMAKAGAFAAGGIGRFMRGAAQKVAGMRASRAEPRRTTAAPVGGGMSVEGRKLRPQSPSQQPPSPTLRAPTTKRKGARIAAIGAVLALAVAGGALAMKKPAEPPGVAQADAAAKTVAVASAAPLALAVDETGDPLVMPPAAKLQPAAGVAPAADPAQAAAPAQNGGIVADVPLFGPTPMATMEPAPLGAPPPAAGGDEAAAEADPEERKEMAAANAALDEGFEDSPSAADAGKRGSPADVKPWGRGEVHTPTIHRIRLDSPGGAIQGAINPTGFTVVIPGRKAMETGKAISARDKRIAAVRTKNGSSGAQISFQFKDGVPGYRVRLRKDVVEFLISAPSEKSAKRENAPVGAEAQTAKHGSKGGSKHASAHGATKHGASKHASKHKKSALGAKKKKD